MGDVKARPRPEETDLLARLKVFPDELARLLAGRSREALERPARDGGWGVIENLCHLRDWEQVFLDRSRAIIREDRPELPAYDDELWAIERDYRGQDPGHVFEEFRELRMELVQLLEGRPDAAMASVGHHAALGDITLRWVAEHVLRHGEQHLQQIREALA